MKKTICICAFTFITVILSLFISIKIFDIRVIIHEYVNESESGILNTTKEFSIAHSVNENYVLNKSGERYITFIEGETKAEYKYSDFNILSSVEDNTNQYIRNHIILKDNKLVVNYTFDRLRESLELLNDNRFKSKYSTIEIVDNNFIVTDEVIGNYINIDKLYNDIVKNIGNNIELNLEHYYEPFDTTKDRQETLQSEVNKINNTYVSYTNGYSIKLTDFFEMLHLDNNKITFIIEDEQELFNYIDNLIEVELIEYDTVGNSYEFTTTSGKTIMTEGGTWGDIYSSDLETEYIIELFKSYGHEDNRTPILKQDYSNEIPDTYIEVSIDDQHVWYYENGELVIDAGCVTGTRNKMDTPHGVYYIFYMSKGAYLMGNSWVDRWMKFTQRGHGLHDAQWRSNKQFGTDRYTWGGSHGCVNLPLQFAYDLYDKIDIGTCVVIY